MSSAGLSNGTFLGVTVLRELELSHNLLLTVGAGQLAGLQSLQVLQLHHNRLQWLDRDSFVGMTELRELSLHNNRLVMLDVSLETGGLQVVSLHHNMWRCRDKSDCAWVSSLSQTLDGGNLTELTCDSGHGEAVSVSLLSFVSSCTNLDVLPVSAQTSPSSSSVMVLVLLIVAMILVMAAITATVVMKHLVVRRGHRVVTYLHYSSQDEDMVRASVGREVGRVARSLCYHHTDLSTNVSVGQAISAAVESSAALVITASPAYIQSAITTAELHIIADCVLQKQTNYPVIVVAPGQSQQYIQQVGAICHIFSINNCQNCNLITPSDQTTVQPHSRELQ